MPAPAPVADELRKKRMAMAMAAAAAAHESSPPRAPKHHPHVDITTQLHEYARQLAVSSTIAASSTRPLGASPPPLSAGALAASATRHFDALRDRRHSADRRQVATTASESPRTRASESAAARRSRRSTETSNTSGASRPAKDPFEYEASSSGSE